MTFPNLRKKAIRLQGTNHIFLMAGIALGICLLTGMIDSVRAQDYALTVFGGRMTEDRWTYALPPGVNFIDTYILVTALSWTFKEFHDDALALEIEGQAAKYHGDQDNFEFNLAFAGRWRKFPWNETVSTSIAFGIGPSWATEKPEAEVMIHGETDQLLVYWFLEATLGPPDADWSTIFRLHHRSRAWGVVADDGGSNTLAAGLKFFF